MFITYESLCIQKQAILHTAFYHCVTHYRTLKYYIFCMSVRYSDILRSVLG